MVTMKKISNLISSIKKEIDSRPAFELFAYGLLFWAILGISYHFIDFIFFVLRGLS